MNILSINPGSTSIKYSLFKGDEEVFFGHFRKTKSRYSFNDQKIHKKDFEESIDYLMAILEGKNLLKNLRDISKFGIRIVHGGIYFKQTTRITKPHLKMLKKISPLAPLHNPPAIRIIEQIQKRNPKAKIYGVFDTAFHQTIPAVASTYAIPRELSQKWSIRKYGFHGIACEWNLHQARKTFKRLPKNIIICHLGGGCSVTAVKNGKSLDTSMGFTPLEGLMMITRSGDLDNGVLEYLAARMKKPVKEIVALLNNESGIYGLTKLKDMKKVVEKAQKKDPWCQLAVEMFVYRLTKYIYAYYGVLQGLDLLIFSGGIGEGSSFIRRKVLSQLKLLKVKKIITVHVEENKEILRELKAI